MKRKPAELSRLLKMNECDYGIVCEKVSDEERLVYLE